MTSPADLPALDEALPPFPDLHNRPTRAIMEWAMKAMDVARVPLEAKLAERDAEIERLNEQIALRNKALNARSLDKFNAVKRAEVAEARIKDLEQSAEVAARNMRDLVAEHVRERDALQALVRELGKENEQLVSRLTCMCGSWADQHSSQDGHHAVPMYDYALDKMAEERDALRARLEAIQKQPTVVMGRYDPDSGVSVDLIERPQP